MMYNDAHVQNLAIGFYNCRNIVPLVKYQLRMPETIECNGIIARLEGTSFVLKELSSGTISLLGTFVCTRYHVCEFHTVGELFHISSIVPESLQVKDHFIHACHMLLKKMCRSKFYLLASENVDNIGSIYGENVTRGLAFQVMLLHDTLPECWKTVTKFCYD